MKKPAAAVFAGILTLALLLTGAAAEVPAALNTGEGSRLPSRVTLDSGSDSACNVDVVQIRPDEELQFTIDDTGLTTYLAVEVTCDGELSGTAGLCVTVDELLPEGDYNLYSYQYKDPVGKLTLCGSIVTVENGAADFEIDRCATYVIGIGDRLRTCASAKFKDVSDEDWFAGYVQSALDYGLMQGKTADTFSPMTKTTRAQFVQILYNMEGRPSVEGQTIPFTDVPSGMWCYDAVVWAYNSGVTEGTSASTFSPNRSVNRQQVAKLLYHYYNKPEIRDEIDGFADVGQVTDTFWDAICWATQNGIIGGYPIDGRLYLKPWTTATRAQTAAMIVRCYQLYDLQ